MFMKNESQLDTLQQYVVEPSGHPHVLKAQKIEAKDYGNSVLGLHIEGPGIITHGEHNTLVTEAPYVMKYVQQELNPVTNLFGNAYD